MSSASQPVRPASAVPAKVAARLTDDAAVESSLDVTVVLLCYNEQDPVVAELERIGARWTLLAVTQGAVPRRGAVGRPRRLRPGIPAAQLPSGQGRI